MSRIRSKNTGIEMAVFSLLDKKRINYKKHYAIIGRPDIAFPQRKVAVFLDSDFWHGWQFPRWENQLPKKYWHDKIEGNRERDRNNFRRLRRIGWRVMRIWSHEIEKDPVGCVTKIVRSIKNND